MRGFLAIACDRREPLGQRRQFAAALQRIARRDHPPELVERQPAQRDLGDQRMAGMRRIEGAAEQADRHALLDMRHAEPVDDDREAPARPWLLGAFRHDADRRRP